MIRSEREYQEAQRQLAVSARFMAEDTEGLIEAGYSPDAVRRLLASNISLHNQLREDVEWYERSRKREFAPARSLADVRRLLIGLRIANGLTQRELADRLGVSESQVSRDERGEYHGITFERAQRILDVLGEKFLHLPYGQSVSSKADLLREYLLGDAERARTTERRRWVSAGTAQSQVAAAPKTASHYGSRQLVTQNEAPTTGKAA